MGYNRDLENVSEDGGFHMGSEFVEVTRMGETRYMEQKIQCVCCFHNITDKKAKHKKILAGGIMQKTA